MYISYKAPTKSSLYKGFKIYYETSRRNSQPNCPTGTPAPPVTGIVTTNKPEVLDLQATEIAKLYVCKGNEKVIERKQNYILFPIDFYYGVTVDGTCENIRYSR